MLFSERLPMRLLSVTKVTPFLKSGLHVLESW